MTQYRKKPVVIDALQFDGTGVTALAHALGMTPLDYRVADGNVLCIQTLEGELTARAGDWIVKGTKGEFYPVKPDIFAQIYEPVE